jgi:DNA-binding SARP family transcriptional activator
LAPRAALEHLSSRSDTGKAITLRAQTTGCFVVYSNGKEITPRSRKARALLAYLISDAGTKMPKDRMASLLWGDRGEEQARSSLRQAILELRLALDEKPPVFVSDREYIWICPDSLIEDIGNLTSGPRDAFEDLDNITPEFDEWLREERSRRAATRIDVLKAEAERLLTKGQGGEARAVTQQMRELDPCNEDSLRLGMKAEFLCGNLAEIAKRYESAAIALKAQFGIEPSRETRSLRNNLVRDLTVVDPAFDARFCDLYHSAEGVLHIGAWECDLTTGQISWTPGVFALFDIPIGSAIRRNDILMHYEPRSRKRLEAARDEAIRNCSGFGIELDIVTKTGIKKRLRIDAAVECRDGVPVRIFGTKRLVDATTARPSRNLQFDS